MTDMPSGSFSGPPRLSPGFHSPAPLGESPGEREAIPNAGVLIEAMLRQPRRVLYQLRNPGSGRLILAMVFVCLVCSIIYGVVAGTFSMGTQIWATPIK